MAPMEENRRDDPRFAVFLYVECIEPEAAPIHVQDLSAGGFLVRGNIVAGQGGILHARFRVHPSSGDMLVSAHGRVMHSRRDGPNSLFGVKIEGFGSPEEERAYQVYVEELSATRPASL